MKGMRSFQPLRGFRMTVRENAPHASTPSRSHAPTPSRPTFSPMKIYTKTGDRGDTGLFGGGRVPKNHPRVEAYGDVDELNAAIGMARAIDVMPRIVEVLMPIQRDLFAIGALLATPDRDKMRQHLEKARVDEERIGQLERSIDDG